MVFHRDSENQTLMPFNTAYCRCANPLFMLLFQGHSYGIKKVKGLIRVVVATVTEAMEKLTNTVVWVVESSVAIHPAL